MTALRRFMRSRQLGRPLAVAIAYALAVQTLMAGAGIGMSAFAASSGPGFVICSHAAATAPTTPSVPQKQNPATQCPFCLAGQTAGHAAWPGIPPVLPIYAASLVTAPLDRFSEQTPVFQLRRTTGNPRAPPVFSV